MDGERERERPGGRGRVRGKDGMVITLGAGDRTCSMTIFSKHGQPQQSMFLKITSM